MDDMEEVFKHEMLPLTYRCYEEYGFVHHLEDVVLLEDFSIFKVGEEFESIVLDFEIGKLIFNDENGEVHTQKIKIIAI